MPTIPYYNHKEGKGPVCAALDCAIERLRSSLGLEDTMAEIDESPEAIAKILGTLHTEETRRGWRASLNDARDKSNALVGHLAARIRELHELKGEFSREESPAAELVEKVRTIVHNCMLYEAACFVNDPSSSEIVEAIESMHIYAEAMHTAFEEIPGAQWFLYPLDDPPEPPKE